MSDPAGRRGAEELGCDWHTVSKEVNRWGEALLEADRDRVGEVEALGLDETLFLRQGPRRQRMWVTSAVDIRNSRLIDVFPGKTAKDAARWLLGQPAPVAGNIGWAALDLSGAYRSAYKPGAAPGRPGRRPIPHRLADQPIVWTGCVAACQE